MTSSTGPPTRAATEPGHVQTREAPRWSGDSSGARYRDVRFRNSRAADRDVRLINRLLQKWPLVDQFSNRTLDAPCGAGRLSEALAPLSGRVVSLDSSASMLLAHETSGLRVRGDALRLPFPDGCFELTVCCRLMHHFPDQSLRARLLTELLRVSSQRVLVSFWDTSCWHAWRRRMGLRKASHPDPRVACSRSEVERLAEAAGGRVLGFAASARFVSPQTFCALDASGRYG